MFDEIIKNLSDIGLVLILFIAIVIFYLCFRTKTAIYYITPSLTNPEFARETREILAHSGVKHSIAETDDPSNADIVIELVSREEMEKESSKVEYYPGTKKRIYFSYTWQRPKPYIAIDAVNWTYGVPESGLSIEEYRKYVIQHEFMHALGYDHRPCNARTAPNGVCPVLYQATRGCPPGFKCGSEITQFDYEKKLDDPYFTLST